MSHLHSEKSRMTDLHSVFSIPHTVLTKDKRGEEEWWSNRLEFHTNSKRILWGPAPSTPRTEPPFPSSLCQWRALLTLGLSGQNTPVFKGPFAWKQSSSLTTPRGRSVPRISSKHQQVGISWHPEACSHSCRELLPQQAKSNASFSIIFNIFKCKILNIRW